MRAGSGPDAIEGQMVVGEGTTFVARHRDGWIRYRVQNFGAGSVSTCLWFVRSRELERVVRASLVRVVGFPRGEYDDVLPKDDEGDAHSGSCGGRCCCRCCSGGRFCVGEHCNFGEHAAAGAAGLRAAGDSRAGLYMDAGLLGVGSRGLLLGAGCVGDAAVGRRAVDARLLGLEWRSVSLSPWLLGAAHWLLWWCELRLRQHGLRV